MTALFKIQNSLGGQIVSVGEVICVFAEKPQTLVIILPPDIIIPVSLFAPLYSNDANSKNKSITVNPHKVI